MNVKKRDGRIVEFDAQRIINAIEKSMSETVVGIDERLSKSITNKVRMEIEAKNEIVSVELIQDLIEEKLMASNRKDVAKNYILYRSNRTSNRTKVNEYKMLDDEFISQYKHKPSNMEPLGEFVYYRTYSRYLPEEKRREYWWETVRRAVEYNTTLVPTTKEEAQKLFDNMFNLRQFLSGRTIWVGNTEVSKQYPMSNFNCAFQVINEFNDFVELFYLLMLGSGVGVRILKDDIQKLPPIRNDYEIINKDFHATPKEFRAENTSLIFDNQVAKIIVGDSKNGWVDALKYYLSLISEPQYRMIKTIVINYDSVRPNGEKLKTFGGTASGHEALKDVFSKIDRVVKSKSVIGTKVKLQPIDCLDVCNIIGEGVVVGGVRRTAEITLFDTDDDACINAKTNLYKEIEGQWIVDEDIVHRSMSNNSIYYKTKPSREKLHWQIEKMRYSGEPAFINGVAGNKRRENFNGVNPCFTGDMRILTDSGYKTLEELNGKDVSIINKEGNISDGKVWCSGEKNIIELSLSNGKTIKCTPNHVFMLNDGFESEAKDLKNKRLKPFIDRNFIPDESYIKFGFIQGDGALGRLNSKAHRGMEVYIGEDDADIKVLFKKDIKDIKPHESKVYSYYINGYNDILSDLKFDSSELPNRVFPLTYNEWDINKKASFLMGCYSANGSIITHHRISYKTASQKFANELRLSLEEFGITANITVNKSKKVTFKNGEYECKESYDVNINKYNDVVRFYETIGFYQEYKMSNLISLIYEKSPMVMKVKSIGVSKVYDFTEPITHWGIIEGFVVHNCAEILLDSKGVCNLTTVNVLAFVNDGQLNTTKLYEAQRLSARAGYRMTCAELELPKWNIVQQRDKLVGCSLTGWQDMINATKMNTEEEKLLLQELRDVAKSATIEYAKALKQKEPLLVTTVKPEGTLSQLPVVSSGIHYSHSPYYIRRIRVNAKDPIVQVCEELGYPIKPEVGQDIETCKTKVVEFPVKAPEGTTKYDVSAIKQLENYKMFMENYVDHNCSITVHVRNNEWEEVEEWVWNNWDDIVAVSFLSLDDSFYDLLPYESISGVEYELRKKAMRPFIPSLISKYEVEETELDLGISECSNGVCPIR